MFPLLLCYYNRVTAKRTAANAGRAIPCVPAVLPHVPCPSFPTQHCSIVPHKQVPISSRFPACCVTGECKQSCCCCCDMSHRVGLIVSHSPGRYPPPHTHSHSTQTLAYDTTRSNRCVSIDYTKSFLSVSFCHMTALHDNTSVAIRCHCVSLCTNVCRHCCAGVPTHTLWTRVV